MQSMAQTPNILLSQSSDPSSKATPNESRGHVYNLQSKVESMQNFQTQSNDLSSCSKNSIWTSGLWDSLNATTD